MTALGIVTITVVGLALAFNVVFWVRSVDRFRYWRKRVVSCPEPESWPSAHVFACLKGRLPDLEETVRSLECQDYPGAYRITFVTEGSADEGDEAALALQLLLRDCDRADHVVAGRVVDSELRCAQKNFNLLAGIRHAKERHGGSTLYAFCDGDLVAQPSWLTEMARPIAIGVSDASTSCHYATAEDRRTIGALHGLAEMCQSLAALVVRGTTWGGSMAILASVFHRHRLEDVWGRTVVDDMTLSHVLKKGGLRVVPIAEFLVRSRSGITSYASFVRWLGRQFFFVKIYLPSLYRLLWTKMTLNVATLWLAAFHIGYRLIAGQWAAGPLAGGAAVAVSAAMIGAFLLYRYLTPVRPPARAWLGAAFLVHGASLLACADATLRRRRLIWQDFTYLMQRDGSVLRVTATRTAPEPEPVTGPETVGEAAA